MNFLKQHKQYEDKLKELISRWEKKFGVLVCLHSAYHGIELSVYYKDELVRGKVMEYEDLYITFDRRIDFKIRKDIYFKIRKDIREDYDK